MFSRCVGRVCAQKVLNIAVSIEVCKVILKSVPTLQPLWQKTHRRDLHLLQVMLVTLQHQFLAYFNFLISEVCLCEHNPLQRSKGLTEFNGGWCELLGIRGAPTYFFFW